MSHFCNGLCLGFRVFCCGTKILNDFFFKKLTRARDDDDDVLDEWRRRWHDHHHHHQQQQQQQRATTSKTGRVAGTLADAEEIRRTIRIRCLVENAIGRGTATRLPKVIFFFSRACYSAKKKKKKKKKRVGGRCFLVSSFASTRDGPRAALTFCSFLNAFFLLSRMMMHRLIQALTLNIDLSSLFADVLMNAATSDVATKKMLYHYIGVYSDKGKESEELTMMTINTLQKDTKHEDPTIRGLAIRSMTSLRSKRLIEYLIECVKEGLRDEHPYARKAACLGCLKVYRLCCSSSSSSSSEDDVNTFNDSGILETVEKLLLEDRDANVVANALVTIVEIFGESDARLQNAALLTALTNKIRDFGELSQHLVLKLTYNYAVLANDANNSKRIPSLPDDVKYQWMNSLESRISSPNTSIALATSRIFLELTKNDPLTHQRVYERIKPSLLTLATAQTSGIETSAVVWAHLKLLAYRAPIAFVTDYKSFYVRVNADSFEIKRCKLRTLSLITDAQNCANIVEELFEYVNDVQDEQFARLAMKAIGRVARKKKESFAMMNAEKRLMVTKKICELFLETSVPSVKADSLIEIGLCLRQCSSNEEEEDEEESKECRSICCKAVESALESVQFSVPDMFSPTTVVSNATTKSITRARSMLLWLLGEFGASGFIEGAPYALESSIENLPEELYPTIRTETFFASLKLFCKRAPEMRKAFETCLKWCATEDSDPSARATVNVYGSLMCSSSSSSKIASDLLLARKSPSVQFSEELEEQERFERLFEEMDTLAITYELEEKKFIDGRNNSSSTEKTEEEEEDVNEQRQQQLDQETSLLQFDDFEADDEEIAAATTSSLSSNPFLDPSQFQLNWQLFPEVAKKQSVIFSPSLGVLMVQSTSSFIDRLKSNGFATAASGGDATQMKFYVYAQTMMSSKWYLIEFIAEVSANKCDWTMKSDSLDQLEVDSVASLFNSMLLSV